MGWSNWSASRIGSFLHAIAVSSIAIYLLATRPQSYLWQPDGINDPLLNTMLQIMFTYLGLDCFMMLAFPSKGDRLYLAHHIVGGFGVFMYWHIQIGLFVAVMFELTELSTVFLNITWYLNKTDRRGFFFKIMGICLLLSFFVTRIYGGCVIYYYLYYHNEKLYQLYSLWQFCYLYGAVTIVFLLNLYWFWKLVEKLLSQV